MSWDESGFNLVQPLSRKMAPYSQSWRIAVTSTTTRSGYLYALRKNQSTKCWSLSSPERLQKLKRVSDLKFTRSSLLADVLNQDFRVRRDLHRWSEFGLNDGDIGDLIMTWDAVRCWLVPLAMEWPVKAITYSSTSNGMIIQPFRNTLRSEKELFFLRMIIIKVKPSMVWW